MKIFASVITITTAVLLCVPATRSQAPQSGGKAVLVSSCNDASIREFLSGMAQGARNFPGGEEFVCRKIGAGVSAEVLVYSVDQYSCGTGGCTLLVLAPNSDLGYIVIGNIRTVWAPIRVLRSKTHGRYDLVALVAGGGILRGYNAKLTYDGYRYPPGGSGGTALPAGSPLGTMVITKAMAANPEIM